MGIAVALFSTLLAFSKRPLQISDTLLAVFLLSIAVPNLIDLNRELPLIDLIGRYLPAWINRSKDFLPLTLGPLMALYAESLTSANYELSKKWLYHFLPFFTFLIIAASFPQYTAFAPRFHPPARLNPLEAASMMALLVSLVGYSLWLEILMKRHKKRVLDYFAQNPNRITLMWLTWVVHFFFVVFVAVHILRTLFFFDLISIRPDLNSFFITASVLFMCSLSYFGVRQSQVFVETFDGSDEAEPEGPKQLMEPVAQSKNRPLNLQGDQLEEYLIQLEDFVKREKPYLDSELTLGDLAQMLQMPKHHLTETLNRKLQKNFYSYINEHRISAIKVLLQDPQSASKTITTLAYQVGFNSRSAFNNFFKKSTQMTPTQFRKIHEGEQ
jgi:AraC-like DNA-binding protein